LSLNTPQFSIATDESDDVAGSIRHALICLQLVRTDDGAWKWLILSLHSALQGSCVCHLTTTAHPVGALTESNTKLWLNYHKLRRDTPDAEPPKTQIAEFSDLLKKIRSSGSGDCADNSNSINISDTELEDLVHLHRVVRNQFVHFEPMGWVLDLMGMQTIIPLVLRVITDILDAKWAFRHINTEQEQSFRETLLAVLAESDKLFRGTE
jgi:hypothetical protein